MSDEMGEVVACTRELTSGHANSKAAHIQGQQPFLPAPECSSTRLTESEASEATEHPGYRALTPECQSNPEFKRIIVNPSMFVGLYQFAVAFIQGC